MYYIIKDYRKLFEQNQKLKSYLKVLEAKLEKMVEKHEKDVAANFRLVETSTRRNRENKRLRAHIAWLADKVKDEYKPFILANDKHVDDDKESL